jgi:lipopolysaccharide biosynthesis glycosyltransferase
MPWGGKLLRALRGDAEAEPQKPALAPEPPVLSPEPEAAAPEPDQPEPTLSHDEAVALLADGVRAFEAGELDQAQRTFDDLRASGRFGDWAAFRLGLIARERGDERAADEGFAAAIAANPELFWAYYERLRLPTVHNDPERRDAAVRAMVDIPWEPLEPPHVAQIEQLAAAIWRDGNRDLAGRLLARAWPSPALSATALARIAETATEPALAEAAAARLADRPQGLDAPATTAGTVHERGAFETAVHDFNARRLAAAAVGFGRLTSSPDLGGWAHFYLGRIHAGGEDQAAAARAFETAIAADPTLFWAHYERTVLARTQNAPAETLVAYVAGMSAAPWETLAEHHVRELEAVAHALWDQAREREAVELLTRLWPSAALGRLALVRLVEKGSDRKIQDEAVDRLQGAADLDETALRVLSAYFQTHGEVDREVAALERSFRAKPADFQTWLGLIRAYAKSGDRQRTSATIANGKTFPPKQRLFVTLIAHLELGDLDDAFFAFRDHCRLYSEVPKFPGIRLAYLLSDLFEVPRRDEVLGILRTFFPGDKDVALVLINAAMRDQRWDAARALFDDHFAGAANLPQNVRQAHVDILAFSGQLDEAARLLEAERIDGRLPVPFLRSTIRILSELDRWQDVFETGLHQLGDDHSFQHFLSPLIRASRKVKTSERLLDGLLALPQPLKPQQLEAIHAVAEDLAEQGDTTVLTRIEGVELPFERRHRIELKLRGRAGPAPVEKDLCIYYCADQNYLMPALVSLTALAMSNVSITRRAVFHLVVDADVVPFAREAGGAIAQRLGLSLEVTDASTIVSSADRLRTSYGLFTGGQQLSLAAYYRIFFARWLVDQQRYAQALYIDADTIVRSGLDELFATENGVPLLARHETDRPEVRHATAVHQLKGAYFNSGVLRFDLAHPALPELLDKAIAAAIDPNVNLIFQDQCALNIAFDLNMAPLPDRFNYFNPPNVSGDGISASDAVIVHFLDRPKPWDSLYRRRAREWFEWYDLVETLRQGMTLGA